MHALVVSRPAVEQYARLTPEDRREVRRLFGLIQADPWIDNQHKVVYHRPPAVYTAYVTARFKILYRMRSNNIIIEAIRPGTLYEPIPT